MRRLLQCEYQKSRGRWIFLTALALTVMAAVFAIYGVYDGENRQFILENGYLMLLYQLPMVNTIFFPVLGMVVASRLCDLEHKGDTLKLLCTLTEKGRLFDAKLLYGLGITLFCVCLYWAACLMAGVLLGFAGPVPWKPELLYLLFTLAPTAVIYVFQHSLSLLVKNQAVALCAGALGEFAGLFSMFLPQLPWLRRSLLWGYYGELQFVGLFDWDKDTRWTKAHFEMMGFDWRSFILLCLMGLGLYLLGRRSFIRKEM